MISIVQGIGNVPGRFRLARTPITDRVGVSLHHSMGPGSPYRMAEYNVRNGGTGHPYHFHAHHNGQGWRLHQTRFLSEVAPHSLVHNRTRWGFVVTGNYDREPLPDEVVSMFADLSACLLLFLGHRSATEIATADTVNGKISAPRVAGHRELLWGSTKRDQGGRVTKSCPGAAVDMDAIRGAVNRALSQRYDYQPEDAHEELITAGVWVREG